MLSNHTKLTLDHKFSEIFYDEHAKLKNFNITIMLTFFILVITIILSIFLNEIYAKYKVIKDNDSAMKIIKEVK